MRNTKLKLWVFPYATVEAFFEHCVTAPGRNLPQRQQLAGALRGGGWRLGDYVAAAEMRQRRIARLELVRKAYRRPLEVWLVADLAMYLEERGYSVEIRTLWKKEVTPRNMVLVGVRKAEGAAPAAGLGHER